MVVLTVLLMVVKMVCLRVVWLVAYWVAMKVDGLVVLSAEWRVDHSAERSTC